MIDPKDLARALGGKISGQEILAPGPGHRAGDRSLSVKLDASAPDGFIVHSFANDDPIACRDYVREKAGLEPFKPNGRGRNSDRPKRKIVAEYDYTDENSTRLYQVVRYEPKDFRQRRPVGKGGWDWNLNGIRRVVYRWPEILQHRDATVFVCEGEKDADRVALLGHCATTVASGKWTDDCIKALADRDIVVLQDNDGAGERKARAAAQALSRVAKTIRIVLLPDLKPGGDVSDWLDADPERDGEQLADICMDAPEWTPTAEAGDGDCGLHSFIKSSKEFVAGFVPPDYLVDGLVQEAFLYSLTGATGAGKTAITLRLAASVAMGVVFANRETKKRRVLYLAAENPVDVRMRWIALAQQMDFDANTIEVFFVEGAFKLSQMAETLKAEAASRGGEFGLVIIDTGPVFYEGDDENNRTQQAKHAAMLRELIDIIPGQPAVIANVHPVKNAAADNLLPAGGGSFLNQVDGNLTAAKIDNTTELHWQGKFRGVEFAPMHFMLKTVTHERLKDRKGRLIPTVISEWISDRAKEEIAKQKVNDEDKLLALIHADPKATLASLAAKMGWKLFSGEPNKMRVQRAIKRMKKLVTETRAGNYRLTNDGKVALKGEE
jgi:hypothetical protein